MNKLFFTLLNLILMFTTLPAQAKHYYYKQIGLKEGLPSNVRCILRDEQGFVWIGTKSGLGKFDGHELKRYKHQANDPHSLLHNLIYQIAEDKQHNIWVLTEKGIARYQRENNNFTFPKDEYGKNITAYSFCHIPEGILFGGKDRIYMYSYKDSSLTLLQYFNADSFKISACSMWDSKTVLCCSRWTGLLLVDLQTGQHRRPPFDCGPEITSMMTDTQKRTWVAPYSGGLRCFSHEGKLLASYTTHNSSLSNDIVLSLSQREGQLWIGTDGGGINILHPETGEISQLEYIPGRENYSLPANSILCIHNDYNNNVWVGSTCNGMISIRDVSMKTYTDVIPGYDRGLSNATVRSLYQQSPDSIWIGTDGGGINLFNPHTENFTHYPSSLGDKVAFISGFTPGKLLISLFSKGVFVFNPATGEKQPFTIIDKKTTAHLCNRGKSVNLYQNTSNTVLLLGDHIYQYHLKEKRFTLIIEEKGKKMIGTLVPFKHEKELTYINDFKSIYELDALTSQLKTVFECYGDTIISSASHDENGHFWIGSNFGLVHYDPVLKSQTHIPTSLFTEVNMVLCDQKGKVWIGADNMLFAWFIKEQKFVLFGESNGAIENEYLPNARLVNEQRDAYIGGIKGMLRIDGKLLLNTSELPELQLLDIIINGESANHELYNHPTKIAVPWNSNVTLHIMSKEEDIFREKIYRYQIKGLKDEYIESYHPELTLRSLPPGHYKIMTSCTAKDGSWIPDQQILELTILPPWYQTWWFILGCAVFISIVIIEICRRTVQRNKEKLEEAMKEHEKQTYKEKVRFLINISHELRTPLTLIYAPLNQILKSLSHEDSQYLSLKAIYRQVQRMKNLINMVLDVRKMEVGESKLVIHPHPLNHWIEQVSQDFISEGEAKNVRIHCQLDSRIETVSFDQNKCEIILTNLLINALKHSPQDTEITIASELLPQTGRVRISIIDQGCGLKLVDTHRLFTRFYQGTGEQSGTGIGLSYSKILIEQHGGSISAQDNQETGATFFFELPLKQESEEIICQPKPYLNELMADDNMEQTFHQEVFDTTSYTALIVDDNPDMTDFLKKTLEKYFKRIIIAKDGIEALQLIRNHIPDIIVSDVMMPRMNGYELCKNIKEDMTTSHIPVILLTAREDKQSLISGYKNGADAYLTKPFEVEILMELINNRLKNREYIKKRYLHTGLIPIPEESTFSQVDETFLLKVNKTIQENLSNTNLDIQLICKEIGLSRSSLYNKLKVLTGMGANDYINKFRIEKAILLITNTEMTFTEIAEEIGFATPSYFSTAFKQHTGETPTQYKEKLH